MGGGLEEWPGLRARRFVLGEQIPVPILWKNGWASEEAWNLRRKAYFARN
jgi:hypothetical protein